MEVKTTGKQELYSDFHGSVKVARYTFEKVKVFKDRNGEVVREIPFTETLTLIKTGSREDENERCLWLRNEHVRELLSKLDECAMLNVELVMR